MTFFGFRNQQTGAFPVVATFILLATIFKENGALGAYHEDNLPAMDVNPMSNDEDDDKDANFSSVDETSTVASASHSLLPTEKQDKCLQDQIMNYLGRLEVNSPEDIIRIASYADLPSICREINETLASIDAWMRTCKPLPANNLYMQLTAGARALQHKLCIPSEYQQAFKKYSECYQQLHNELIDCAGPADWTENLEDHELCNQYKLTSDCYYTQTAMLCGITAAKTWKELVVRVINAAIETHCPEVRKNPVVENPMPEHSVYARKSGLSSRIFPAPMINSMILIAHLFSYILHRCG